MRQCEIYLHGIKCGLLTEEDDKTFTFSYDSVYLQRADADPVSLTLPLQREPHKSPYLFRFLPICFLKERTVRFSPCCCGLTRKTILEFFWQPVR